MDKRPVSFLCLGCLPSAPLQQLTSAGLLKPCPLRMELGGKGCPRKLLRSAALGLHLCVPHRI